MAERGTFFFKSRAMLITQFVAYGHKAEAITDR